MKILFITNYFYPVQGGVENHIYNLSRELIKKGHDIEVWCSDQSRKGRIRKKYEMLEKIKIRRFKSIFKIGDFGVMFPKIFKEIRKNKFDIIHIHVYRHLHNLIPLFTKSKFIMTPHWPNYPKELRTSTANILITFFDVFLGRFILKKYNNILCITELEKKWFMKKFNLKKEKLKLLPNGIPKNKLNQKKKKHKGINVLCIGRQHKSKGFDQVIKIAKYLPKLNFIIAGVKGDHTKFLKFFSRSQKNVNLLTNISEKKKKELFSKADIFIHPSHYEGFGIVVLEAFSNKLPVITSNKGGLPWVVKDAGLTFKDYDLPDLKKKLDKLIKSKSLREKLSMKGYQRVKNFTWDKIALDLEKIYKKT